MRGQPTRSLGLATLVAGFLAGCNSGGATPTNVPGGGGPGGGGPGGGGPGIPGAVGNGCFIVKADGAYVTRANNSFVANATDPAAAERFQMRITGLDRFLFYTPNELFLTGSGTAISATVEPSDGSDWTFTDVGDGFHATIVAGALAVAEDHTLALGEAPALLAFEPATGCAEYPEMPTGVTGTAFKNPLAGPVVGFAGVHEHMSMGSEMSDGSRDVGPSAAGVMYGHAVNRFGAKYALRDCAALHGENGSADPEAAILDGEPGKQHETQGWPTFVDWPKRDSQLHQQMYWKWVERAYMAGMRVMTLLATNIEALCQFAKDSGASRGFPSEQVDCKDMGVGMKQVAYIEDMQDYIDAQHGGPGKGWFRIVKDPAEARAVIAEGKLAVVPGLEFSNIFECNVTWDQAGTETRHCTKEQIDQQIDEIWEAGVRQVFPFHDVDSALGGTGIFSELLNLVGYYGTNRFWETYPCEDGGEGEKFFYEAGTTMSSGGLSSFNDPISRQIVANGGGAYPIYGPGRQCNARDVTDLGAYAVHKIMSKGFVFDIDHAEIRSKQMMLDYAELMEPDYPMVSGHGGHGGINNLQAEQIIRQGGIIYPSLPNGKDYVEFVDKVKARWEASGTARPLSVGYGADANGLHNLPRPRGMGSTAIEYPFTLFKQPDWGPTFASIPSVQFAELSIPGGKTWNMDEEGMSHYGLVADIVEEIRIEGGPDYLDAFYNSAETYLKMWEQTLAASEDARAKPVPEDLPRRTP